MSRNIKRLTLFGMLIALAFVLSWLEHLIPSFIPIPGIKLGLANLVVLVALYCLGARAAFALSLLRVLLTALTFGNFYMGLFSLSGAIISFLVMILLKKSSRFSLIGVSTGGGVAHNLGQIIVACLTLGRGLLYYLPFLIVGGVVSGILIGVIGYILVSRITPLSSSLQSR